MSNSFIEILKAVFLGIVEGITEWLPISSTGHMLLVDEFLQRNVFRCHPAWGHSGSPSAVLE